MYHALQYINTIPRLIYITEYHFFFLMKILIVIYRKNLRFYRLEICFLSTKAGKCTFKYLFILYFTLYSTNNRNEDQLYSFIFVKKFVRGTRAFSANSNLLISRSLMFQTLAFSPNRKY